VKVTRFHHVSVNTGGAPLAEMVAFYGGVFGLADKARPEIPGVPGHWHAVGDQELHLVGAPPSGAGIDPTGNHFCVAVDDLDAAITELEAAGIEYRRGVQGEGIVQIWITDPAGNTIELQQETRTA
jgi:catechol 2,3-dioxygenase-like lactoylglutathione lyase family enzyme